MASCKIDLLIQTHDISAPTGEYDDVDEYLRRRWLGEDGRAPDGYETLTTWFNKRLLKRVYETNGRETMGVRLDSEYEALTGEDEVLRGEVEDDLAADGIDPEALHRDFVSRSTMRRHLNDCLDESKDSAPTQSDWERKSIHLATKQAHHRIEKALQSLATKNELPPLDAIEIDVSVSISCADDPYQVPIEEALGTDFNCLEGGRSR